MSTLDYTKWANFKGVIEKSIIACENSHIRSIDHFAETSKTVPMPEDLPTPQKSVKELKKEKKKRLKLKRNDKKKLK